MITRTLSATLAALLVTFISGSSLHADVSQSLERYTVKVRSGRSYHFRLPFSGSGLMFKNGGSAYVLTSEHVVLHGNSRSSMIRHTVAGPGIGTVAAKLVAVDWGVGLALLQVEDLRTIDVKDLPGLDMLSCNSTDKSGRVKLLGFPHQADEMVESLGDILETNSTRHEIPMLDSMIEIVNGHGEFGMSGGPVLSDDAGGRSCLVGLLSHQFIEMVPAGRSRVEEFSNGSKSVRNHVLAIASKDVLEWVKGYLHDPSRFQAAFIRDPNLQLEGAQVVLSAGLRFELMASDRTENNGGGIGGSDAVGIGGGDAVGIGGSDPVGIGGDSKMPSGPVTRITVDVGSQSIQTSWQMTSRKSWFERIKKHLLANRGAITIPYFIRRDEEGVGIARVPVASLGEFVHELAQSKDRPLVVADKSMTTSVSYQDLIEIKKAGDELRRLSALVKKGNRVALPASHELLRSLQIISDAAASNDWEMVLDGPYLTRVEGQQAAWDHLFDVEFDSTVLLLKNLRVLRQAILRASVGG